MTFAHLLRAEWTKFRTVRSWLIGTVVAAFVLVLIGLVSAEGSRTQVAGPGGGPRRVTVGPDGRPANDAFTFAHRTLTGDGSITARVASLTAGREGQSPWAKAGLMIKASTTPGATYAAVMVTPAHGVRMQYDFTGDVAGPRGPTWLRLVRTGQTVTGYASADGAAWTKIDAIRLPTLPAAAEIGLFTTSPAVETFVQHVGSAQGDMYRTSATATFADVTAPGAGWQETEVDDGEGSMRADGGTVTLTGSGNIAPISPDGNSAIERTLVGTFAGLTAVIVLAVLFVTSEYRRGMIRTTFAASPARGRALGAKALVAGTVAFGAGLVGAAVALPLCRKILIDNGNDVFAVDVATQARIVLGTAAMLAVVAVLAMSVGTLMRRSVGAVAAVIVLVVLPYLLATAAVLPAGPADWLLRLTPAAAFAVQQTAIAYPQVEHAYVPAQGFYPLAPWAGFGVLCLWAAAALGLAVWFVRRRDA